MDAATIVALCVGSVSAAIAIVVPYIKHRATKREKNDERVLVQHTDYQRQLYLYMVKIRSYTRTILETAEESVKQRSNQPLKDFPRNSVYHDMAFRLGSEFPGITSSYEAFMNLEAKIRTERTSYLPKFGRKTDQESLADLVSQMRDVREELKRQLNMAANSIGYAVIGDGAGD